MQVNIIESCNTALSLSMIKSIDKMWPDLQKQNLHMVLRSMPSNLHTGSAGSRMLAQERKERIGTP